MVIGDAGLVVGMTVMTDVGTYRQTATLSESSAPVANGDGDFSVSYVALNPAEWRCAIERASVSSAERNFASTIIAQATHVLRGRFHPAITTRTRIQWSDRNGDVHIVNVIDVDDPEGAGVETVVAAAEIVDAVPPTDTTWVEGGWVQ